MKKVQGYNNLYRNDAGAIVNTDTSGYHAYRKKVAKNKRKDEQISNLSEDLDRAKKEIEELKALIKEALLNRDSIT